jgi:hypothetical protein
MGMPVLVFRSQGIQVSRQDVLQFNTWETMNSATMPRRVLLIRSEAAHCQNWPTLNARGFPCMTNASVGERGTTAGRRVSDGSSRFFILLEHGQTFH